MSERSSSIQLSTARTIDATLVALGFVRGADGTLTAPTDSVITFAPIGSAFLELKITLADGSTVTAVLAAAALKINCVRAMERRDGRSCC
jgi:hypothetical protein